VYFVSALSVCCQFVSSILPVYWSPIARPDYRLAIKTSLKPVCDQFDVRSDNKLNIHWLHTKTVKYFVFLCIYKVDELKSSPKWEKKQANFGKNAGNNSDNTLTLH